MVGLSPEICGAPAEAPGGPQKMNGAGGGPFPGPGPQKKLEGIRL